MSAWEVFKVVGDPIWSIAVWVSVLWSMAEVRYSDRPRPTFLQQLGRVLFLTIVLSFILSNVIAIAIYIKQA